MTPSRAAATVRSQGRKPLVSVPLGRRAPEGRQIRRSSIPMSRAVSIPPRANRAASPAPARLGRRDYATDPVTLAKSLIGCRLVRALRGRRLAGIIVETEAYLGVQDRAAHSFGGRRTPRVEPMYAKPGTAYVYFTYGMHHCMNVVAGREGEPVAVLIRALEPIEGLERMRALRAARRPGARLRDTDLCSGPAKLCEALAIDSDLSAIDLVSDPRLFIEPRCATLEGPIELVNTARIGVGYADEWAAAPLRWFAAANPHVSIKGPCPAGQKPRRPTRPRT